MTFMSDELDYNAAPIFVNSINVMAAISGSAQIVAVGEYTFTGLQPGISYALSAVAVNLFGNSSSSIISSPVSQQPADQVPLPPLNPKVTSYDASQVQVQFHRPIAAPGAPPVSSYRIQYDSSPLFGSGTNGAPYKEIDLQSNIASAISEVQIVSVVASINTTIGGSFALSFMGHPTQQMDFNISAAGLKQQLENLSPIRQVAVQRELICSSAKGLNDCGNLLGYSWLVTFIDTIDSGYLYELPRFAVDGTYLKSCPYSDPLNCVTNSTASAFLHRKQELQEVRQRIFSSQATVFISLDIFCDSVAVCLQ